MERGIGKSLLLIVVVFSITFVSSFNFPLGPGEAEFLGGHPPSFFVPLNTSLFGNMSWNDGCLNGGVSISGGDICAQRLLVFNITALNVTQQNLTITDNAIFLGKLGIGTDDPQTDIHIFGASNEERAITLGRVGQPESAKILYNSFGASNDLSLWINGQNAMTIDSSRRVGIGVTQPEFPLHLEGGADTTFLIREVGNTGGDARIQFENEDDNADSWRIKRGNTGKFQIDYSASQPFAFPSTTKFTIDTDGFIGINTSTPSHTLNVIGDGNFTGNLYSNEFIGAINATFVRIALGAGTPMINQLQEYIDNTGSSGFFLGGELSDGGSGTLDVAAGSGFIRTTNDDRAELQSFSWSASSGIPVTDDTTQYVYVDDSGTISLSQDEFLERPNLIKIGVVTDESGAVSHVFKLGVRLEESIGEAGRFIRGVHGISRNTRIGGLIFGQSGDANRDVTMTAGQLEWGRTSYPHDVFDTSGADTFATYSASGQEDATASQFPNEQYDNAGTLTTMTNNRWANLFFFLEPDGHVVMIYGREQFVTEGQAEEEGVPSTSLPSRVSETSILASRFTFQKSDDIATIASAFDTIFANAGVTSHGSLSGLSADDHPQYLLVDGSGNMTGNITLNNGGMVWDNSTCTFMSSPDGSTVLEVCNA